MLKVNLAHSAKVAERAGITWCFSWELGWSYFSVFCPMLPDSGKWQAVLGVPWPCYGAHEVAWQGSREGQHRTENQTLKEQQSPSLGKHCPSLSEWSQNWQSLRSGCVGVMGTAERDRACLCPSSSQAWLWSILSHSGLSWAWHHLPGCQEGPLPSPRHPGHGGPGLRWLPTDRLPLSDTDVLSPWVNFLWR